MNWTVGHWGGHMQLIIIASAVVVMLILGALMRRGRIAWPLALAMAASVVFGLFVVSARARR